MKENIFLSIVIPAYNQEKRFGEPLKKIIAFCKQKEYTTEILIVDDGSKDNTKKMVTEILESSGKEYNVISYPTNRGKGYALSKGMLAARGKYSIFMDADLATPLVELDKFIPTIQESDCDIVIGTRKVKASQIDKRQPFLRELMGKGFTFLSNIILNTNVSDFTCGFKLFKNEVGKKLFSVKRINGWSYDAEIIFLAKKFDFHIIEVPVNWEDIKGTKVNLIKDTIKSFFGLLYIQYLDITGKY